MLQSKKTISQIANILSSPIEYLKGVGPVRGDMLKKELNIFSFQDLLDYFPLRHIDKTRVQQIRDIRGDTDFIQLRGRIIQIETLGENRSKRLVAQLKDPTGSIELAWFRSINWVQKTIEPGREYLVYGKISFFLGKPQMTHPEFEPVNTEEGAELKSFLEPVYPVTEKLKARGITARNFARFTQQLFLLISEKEVTENLPEYIITHYKLLSRWDAYHSIHFPSDTDMWNRAVYRLKFEELFFAQIRLGLLRSNRHRYSKGVVFSQVGEMFNRFYSNHLPFELTGAQKRVLKEIRQDTARGRQMNRLLQGDVGSGKTVVALMTMLIAHDNGFQSCMMAPTEILARQHFLGISALLSELPLSVKLLTGSTKSAERKKILEESKNGNLSILIGTHALIESAVQFNKLGLAVIDEQHRFGVEQRAKLWEKGEVPPHVLVMTATPIPRTLAMTAYGDLDTSVIDELPPGRQPIITVHRLEDSRPQVMEFIRSEIKKGRQAYVIFPLIEESEKLNYENLMKGYENIKAWFPEPRYWISMVHGKMPADQKEVNMQRFVAGETQIMVSTTVIEVGVNVPNATVMVIESAEKFGLSQLHQLRGRVGRGSDKSYCILLTGNKVSNDARSRLGILCSTNDGFKIAEKDLELRGPGDIEGTRQSGALNFKLANIVSDKLLLEKVKLLSERLLNEDPDGARPENKPLFDFLKLRKAKTPWSKIS